MLSCDLSGISSASSLPPEADNGVAAENEKGRESIAWNGNRLRSVLVSWPGNHTHQ